jgi:uncharacterized protein (DUF1499 family)
VNGNDTHQKPGNKGSLVARLGSSLAIIGLLAVGTGPLAVHAGVAKPLQGFVIFGLGLFFGLLAFLIGLIALLRTRGSEGVHRSRAWLATGIGLVLAGVFAFLYAPSASLPRINDFTTDPGDPPTFAAAKREPANQDRDLSYPTDSAAQQRAAYPDLAPIVLEVAPADAFVRAQRAAGQLGWKTTYSDPEAGVFEAQDISPTFLFVDDVVVRIRPEGASGSRIDLRSKSRDGKGDMGVNAKRIRAFTAKVQAGK